jgi:hypothetical protein
MTTAREAELRLAGSNYAASSFFFISDEVRGLNFRYCAGRERGTVRPKFALVVKIVVEKRNNLSATSGSSGWFSPSN